MYAVLKSVLFEKKFLEVFEIKTKKEQGKRVVAKEKEANKKPLKINRLTRVICDRDRIQTYNLLSRNQVRYSVAPRGR
jgi:hypothetical protein